MFGPTFFLTLVAVAFSVFGGVMAYQSFAEWRWRKSHKR
jgi:hypothetical protein